MLVALLLASELVQAAVRPGGKAPCRALAAARCVEGEVQAGQSFERSFGNGLEFMLEPLASGWMLRVLPANGPRGRA